MDSRLVIPSALTPRHRLGEATADAVAQFAPAGGHDGDVAAAYRSALPGIDSLLQLAGVTVLRGERAQVLAHQDHTPRGMFLFLDGELALTSPCGCTEVVESRAGLFIFPCLDEVDEPSGRVATFRRNSLVIYVPRSLVLLDGAVHESLAGLLMREVSLRAPHESTEAHP